MIDTCRTLATCATSYADVLNYIKFIAHVLMQVGFLSSWSAYNTYLTQNPDAPDPLVQFGEEFHRAALLSSHEQQFSVKFPIFVMLCSNTRE